MTDEKRVAHPNVARIRRSSAAMLSGQATTDASFEADQAGLSADRRRSAP